MNLTESVNGWQAWSLGASNTFANYQNRNASFHDSPPNEFPDLAWQSITISNLRAVSDVREIQGGTPSTVTDFFGCGWLNAPARTYNRLAMDFTSPDQLNLTLVSLYYGTVNSPPAIPLNIQVDNGGEPGSTILGSGTLSGGVGDDWHNVSVSTAGGGPITLNAGVTYWIVMDGSAIPMNPVRYYKWFYVVDPTNPAYDGKHACYYTPGSWQQESNYGLPWNFLALASVISINGNMEARSYSSPAQVNMWLNGTMQIANNVTFVPKTYHTFVLSTNSSVTFTANWTARFEDSRIGDASTRYSAREGFTLWNVTFTSNAKPSNMYTWFNKTFTVATIPLFWSSNSPPTNITNNLGFSSSFVGASTYYIISQTSGLGAVSWDTEWTIATKSTYKVTASLPSQVVEGLPLTLSVLTGSYQGSWCNVTFYNATDHPYYSKNITMPSNSLSLLVKLNVSGVYTLFLFDKLTNRNEASLDRTLTISVIEPLCNLTEVSIDPLVLGSLATAQFRFLNGTAGWAAIQPIVVMINGTSRTFDYAGGVVTVSWSTAFGEWRSGPNHVNITSVSGVYFNFTVASFTITPPNAILTLNATSYAATYADSIPIGFTFLNLTSGSPQPFPSPPTLYRNGTAVTFFPDGSGSYVYVLDTHMFAQAGTFLLNFTAKYLAYTATNITTLVLSKIPMSLSIQTPQTSVTIGSSLSVSAILNYGNGTLAHSGFDVQFNFIVTFVNGSTITISKTEVINNGAASSSLLATSDMKSIDVNATYVGSGIIASATTDLISDIQVVAPQGLSLMTIMIIGGGGGALVVALLGIAKYRGARKRTEVRKTKALVQTASLAQLIVVHLASGRALYSRSIGSEGSADANLISGFLSANQSIIAEVFKKKPGAGLKFADYGEYKVVSNVGNNVMATLFCTEAAGEELQTVLQSFTDKFEKKYAAALKSWDGNMNVFKDADDIADEVFSMPLCSPYMLLEVPISKLNKDERAAVHTARILSAERGVFFMPRVVDFLLTKQGLKRGKAMDVIDSLTKKGVFRQLTIEQAAQVVKSTTEKAGDQA
jgi:hypothetical protein